MESTQYKKPLFPASRLQTTDEFRYYVTYGTTPAEDLLECVSTVKEPVVLLLGCGDLRSVLYSIWKNFNTTHNSNKGNGGDRNVKESCRFTHVKFVMTDYSAAVLARDILFLYLCVQRPKEEATSRTARWLGAIWSIWYCHELLSHHERTLSSALSALVGFGTGMKAWSSSDNPIGSFVSFSSKYMLRDICDVWKMWLDKSFGVKSVAMVRADRLREKKLSRPDGSADEPLHEYYGSILSKTKAFERRQEAMKSEVSSYEETGTVFAECVLNESFVPGSAKTSVNHTFYERPDGGYSIYHDILPFRSYHHGFQFSPSELLAVGVSQSIVSKLPVPERSFEKYPLLANSVQQLALWLYSCASIFTQCTSDHNGDKPRISFMFHCSEAIHFCRELQNSYHGPKLPIEQAYDVIHTATLCEIVSLSNILLYATPLLKPDGLLYTGTLKEVGAHCTTKSYVEHSTGINTKLMPLIFGIRVLSYSGSGYNSLLPGTPEQKKLHGKWHFTTRNIIWKRVVLRHALCLPHLGSSSDLCDSLIAVLPTSVGPKVNTGPLISTTSAIRVLQMFVAQAAVDPNDFNYWFRLCELVDVLPRVPFMGGRLKRFLPDLQMLAYLHGLHIHLAVEESCCATCRGLRMYEFIGQYCVELELSLKDRLGIIMAYLHEGVLNLDDDKAKYHMVSTLAMIREGKGSKKVKLHFYCPVTFDQNGYTVTLIDTSANGNQSLVSGKLTDFKVRGYYKHSFDAPPTPVPKHTPTSFGSLTSHLGNGHVFESEVTFSEKAFNTYSESKQLEPSRMSPYDIELSCGKHKISISYPYCIDYSSLSLKISKKSKTVSIHAKRAAYDFEQEIPLYMSDPNNPFLLPAMTFDKKTVEEFCRNQFNDEEFALRSSPDAPTLVKMKNIIADLLQKDEAFFFTYSEPGGSDTLLVVNNRVFDGSRKTPAIDLSFCFAKHGSPVFPIWSTMVESPVMSDIPLDLYQFLERVLKFFAKRTAPLASPPMVSNERLDLLSHWKLTPCFTRAVVYPIYFNPDPEVRGLPSIDDFAAKILAECDPETRESYRKLRTVTDLDLHEGYRRLKKREKESKCSYCAKMSENLRKCTRCQTVQYCNKDCQQKHWKLHKVSCKESTTEPATATTATTTGKKDGAAATTSGSTKPAVNRPPTSISDSQSKSEKGDGGPKPFISLGIPDILQCHYCSKILTMVKKCGGCLNATYCDKHCQEQHWKYGHKSECEAAKRKRATKAAATPSLPEYSSFSRGGQAWRETKPGVIETKCTFCRRMPSELVVCHCDGAFYCGTECRKSDWETHRGICKCKRCKKKSTSLMMCPCVRAAYCGRTCQKLDWPNHKPFCPLNKRKEELLYD